MATRTHISELAELRDAASVSAMQEVVASSQDVGTLCANFRFGCNAGTEGPDQKGFLTLCWDCQNAEGFLLAGRGGITLEKGML